MIIYRTINILTKEWYIGQDSKNNPHYLGGGVILKRAIKKYGRENFYKEILQKLPADSTKEDLNKAEIFWIHTMNAVCDINSYNIASGGSDVSSNPEVGLKISEAMIGNKNGRANSKYCGQKNSQYGKRGSLHHLYGKPSPKKGTKATPDQIMKNALSHGARKFRVYKKIDKTLVGEWIIQSECASSLGIDFRGISACISGKRKTYRGYIFEVVNE